MTTTRIVKQNVTFEATTLEAIRTKAAEQFRAIRDANNNIGTAARAGAVLNLLNRAIHGADGRLLTAEEQVDPTVERDWASRAKKTGEDFASAIEAVYPTPEGPFKTEAAKLEAIAAVKEQRSSVMAQVRKHVVWAACQADSPVRALGLNPVKVVARKVDGSTILDKDGNPIAPFVAPVKADLTDGEKEAAQSKRLGSIHTPKNEKVPVATHGPAIIGAFRHLPISLALPIVQGAVDAIGDGEASMLNLTPGAVRSALAQVGAVEDSCKALRTALTSVLGTPPAEESITDLMLKLQAMMAQQNGGDAK